MESFIAVLALVGFALLCVLVSAALSALKARRAAKKAGQKKRLLIHSINDDRCTGCEACVTVCPTDVLDLQQNKSRVLRFQDCIQCEQCAMVCPTTALVMHYQGTQAPPYRMPDLDEFYQAAPGLYLIGEAAGKPLVKNANNLGRAVVEHLVRTGLRPLVAPPRSQIPEVDVLIVGSGPGGLAAALTCIERRLSFAVLEKDELVASTIARWPKGKECMAEPYDVRNLGPLPVWDSSKEELVGSWQRLLEERGVKVLTRESVDEVRRDADGLFQVRTSKRVLRAQRLVLSIGTRGKPRRLGIPGEHLPKVTALLTDAALHKGQRVMVVGGGDSAVEAAIALAETARLVILSYRGKALSRCKAKNRQRLDQLVAAGSVQVRFGSNVTEVRPQTVLLKAGEQVEELPNDHLFVCIGGDAPVKWLEAVGVKFREMPHEYARPNTDELIERLCGPQRDVGPVSRPNGGPGGEPVLRFPAEKVRRMG